MFSLFLISISILFSMFKITTLSGSDFVICMSSITVVLLRAILISNFNRAPINK